MDPTPPPPTVATPQRFPCRQCGAKLVFAPGTNSLHCDYCGCENAIARPAGPIEELDYTAQLAELASTSDAVDTPIVTCTACAAQTTPPPNTTALRCPFCGSEIVTQGASKAILKPRSLLPFQITRQQAATLFRDWIGGLWFAPSELKRYADGDTRIDGLYMPAWTYDCATTSQYTGSRGEYYWTTETYTTVENGKTVTRTRRVRHIRWWPASGVVRHDFDDLLVLASKSLPTELAQRLEPWDLAALVAYTDDYLSGFYAERYQVELPDGFAQAQEMMVEPIRADICADIGGDEQRIDSVNTSYHDITFKHILLPVWISAYRYRDRTFRYLVNARTGEVQGERPWSALKITLFVLACITAAAGIAFAFAQGR